MHIPKSKAASHLHWWSFACSDAISSTDPCQTGLGFTRRMQTVAELVFKKLKARVDSKGFTFSGYCKGQVKVGDMILHKDFAIASAHTLSTPDANLTQKECFLQRFGDPRLAVELAPRSLSAWEDVRRVVSISFKGQESFMVASVHLPMRWVTTFFTQECSQWINTAFTELIPGCNAWQSTSRVATALRNN